MIWTSHQIFFRRSNQIVWGDQGQWRSQDFFFGGGSTNSVED